MPKTRRQGVLVNASQIGKIKKSRMFTAAPILEEKPTRRFYIFKYQGDEIEGILGPPIANPQKNTSYPILLDDGTIKEIFGNKLLHVTINDNELIGARVRVVYVGRQHIPGYGRERKIYEVWKIEGTKESLQSKK